MVNFEPLKKPVKAKKYYTGTFTDNEGKTVTIENGQVKSIKSP